VRRRASALRRIAPRSRRRRRNPTTCIPTARRRIRPSAPERCALQLLGSQVGIWTYPNGHSISATTTTCQVVAALKDPVFRDYSRRWKRRRARRDAKPHPRGAALEPNIYPTCPLMSQFQQLRVVHPIPVEPHRRAHLHLPLKGAPDRLFATPSASPTSSTGTGSLVLTDDLEIYNRIDMGLSSHGAEWLQIGRATRATARPARRPQRIIPSEDVYIRNMSTPGWAIWATATQQKRRQRARRLKRRWRKARPNQNLRPESSARHSTSVPGPPVPAALDLHRCMLFLEHERGCSTKRSSTTA